LLAAGALINTLLTISGHHWIAPSGHRVRELEAVTATSRWRLFHFRGGASSMSVDNLRPEVNLLSAFTLMIVGALATGLPMALAIIWVCS